MTTMAPVNGNSAVESKSAKKRKAKAEAAADASTGLATPAGENSQTPTSAAENSQSDGDGPHDSPYLKELSKSIRNIHKKLSASAKADAVIAENPDLSLDDLVVTKKLNADQKAQQLKKPGLKAQLKTLEEQIEQYRRFGKEYEDRFAREKAAMTASHKEELVKARHEAAAEATERLSKQLDEDLLVLSQFLHAAAAKRQTTEADSEEGRAFEGALLQVYQGNSASLTTLKNLTSGSSDKVTSTAGETLDFTFAQVKLSSIDNAPDSSDFEEPVDEDQVEEPIEKPVEEPVEDEPVVASVIDDDVEASTATPATDLTVAHAGLTELEDSIIIQASTNGTVEAEPEPETMDIPEQSSTGADAANAVAENHWDAQASATTNESTGAEGWVEIPRDPAETDTGLTATPAAVHGSSSWAEEVTEGVAAEEKAAVENDGFEQVVHHPNRERGRGRGRGSDFRGRGRGGGDGYRGGRGRGDRERGDGERRGRGGRGRGEGGYRGSRGRGDRGRDGQGGGAAKPADAGS